MGKRINKTETDSKSDYIFREAVIDNRVLSPREMLAMLAKVGGRQLLINAKALNCMPRREGRVRESVSFFQLWTWTDVLWLSSIYNNYGLVPDPYAQGVINRDDPAFADNHPNFTYWADEGGKYHFMICDRSHETRYATVQNLKRDFAPGLWACGVGKLNIG